MDWYIYLAVIGIGVLAGFINTLAGGGSALSLPFLIFLGLPANVANGTNRIAILLQNAVAVKSFHKQGVLDLKKGMLPGIICMVGAIAGASFAVHLNEFLMKRIIGVVLIVMLVLVIFKPGLWLKSQDVSDMKSSSWLSVLVFVLIGAYGGFIQVGVGFFSLAGLVLVERLNLLKANAIKVLIILMLNIPAFLIFIINQQVDYKLGLVLAIGNMSGAWLGSKVAVSWGPKFIRYVLIIALVGSSLRLFGLL